MDDFDTEFDNLWGRAYGVAYVVLGDRGESEDIAQETLRARARALGQGVGVRRAVGGSSGRKSRDRPGAQAQAHARAGDRTTFPASTRQRVDLQRALLALSPKQRDVVVLRYLVDLPEAEVAQADAAARSGRSRPTRRADSRRCGGRWRLHHERIRFRRAPRSRRTAARRGASERVSTACEPDCARTRAATGSRRPRRRSSRSPWSSPASSRRRATTARRSRCAAGPRAPTPTSTTTRRYAVGDRFVPPTTIENGLVMMPVTFPDGETTTLRYPPAMKIAQLGFAGGIGVNWPVDDAASHCCGKQVSITYPTIADVYGDATADHGVPGRERRGGPTTSTSQASSRRPKSTTSCSSSGRGSCRSTTSSTRQLRARMTDAQRATWARSLTGTRRRQRLSRAARGRAALARQRIRGRVRRRARATASSSTPHLYCDQPGSDTSAHRQFTNERRIRRVVVRRRPARRRHRARHDFVDLAAEQLQVEPLGIADHEHDNSTTTTTTTTVPAGPPSAVSASFVSPTHGWVLEQQRRRRRDHRRRTHAGDRVGSLGSTSRTRRSASPTRRTASRFRPFEPNPAIVDGDRRRRRTWTTLARTVLRHRLRPRDLARHRVRGRVRQHAQVPHLVEPGRHTSRGPRTRSRSRSAAGPVPSIQLVFSNGAGWLIEVDRVVVAGAQMSTDRALVEVDTAVRERRTVRRPSRRGAPPT